MDKSSKIDGFHHDMLYFLKTCAKAVRNGRNTMRITPEQAGEFHCPRWEELPKLLLYMDQVILVLEETLSLFVEEKECVVTSTMINNYVKQKVIKPPVQKKYGREQLAQLMVVCLLKKVLSINEIAALMSMMTARYSPKEAYDSFCSALENALVKAFAAEKREVPPISGNEPALVAQSAALAALMGKLMVENCLAQAADAKETAPDKPQAQKKPPAKTQPKNADMAKAEKGASAPDAAEEQAQ